jgi:hypothetical protein
MSNAKSNRQPVAPVTERATPAAQQANTTGPGSLDGGGGSPARPQTGRWTADRPTLPFGCPQQATAASCGSGERILTGGDSRLPARSGGSASRRGAAAASPRRGADREVAYPRARCGFNVSRNPPSSSSLSPCPPPPPWCHSHGAAAELDTIRNVVIYDENFMTFLNSVTIAHNP